MSKTIREVTLEEWGQLVEAADELLGCARFQYWLAGSPNEEDTSILDSINRMAAAFEVIGLRQISQQQFETNLESLLTSQDSPDRWKEKQLAWERKPHSA